ncbi:hypothetical protein NT6N_37720 [Oceaniferula spumae]|uniref:Uncharacterized protein n=1 Tax=Oceaniferula spumae TaxID=2979115 RepID=A0AAT9FS61_9BACT
MTRYDNLNKKNLEGVHIWKACKFQNWCASRDYNPWGSLKTSNPKQALDI